VVHSVGGWIVLAAAIVIGPREGKYGEDGSIRRFTASNLILAALGTFLLWLGWFGFNAGSTLSAGPDIALITLNTALGGRGRRLRGDDGQLARRAAAQGGRHAERRPRRAGVGHGGLQRAPAARRRLRRDDRRPDRLRVGTLHRRRAPGGRRRGRDLGPRRLRRVGDAGRRPVRQDRFVGNRIAP